MYDDDDAECEYEYSDENQERREAELEMIRAAYSPDEAWIVEGSENSIDSGTRVSRKLEFPAGIGGTGSMFVELVVRLPPSYPADESAILRVDASPSNDQAGTVAAFHRKAAIDGLPDLIRACRRTAVENAGCEAIFVVFSEAETWIEDKWPSFLDSSGTTTSGPTENEPNQQSTSITATDDGLVILGRKLIYSHHIIAKSKRRAISDLAKELKLGGYYKIGWPGIIIIEGPIEDCDAFYAEIRKLRWQQLVLRGEESETVAAGVDGAAAAAVALDDHRRFPQTMTELGENQMSDLAELCRKAGLEDLFKTSMKIYKAHDAPSNVGNENSIDENREESAAAAAAAAALRYGTLVHVDHMNDPKGYSKWIRSACKSAGCSCVIGRCCVPNHDNDHNHHHERHQQLRRPIIVVALVGDDESSLKTVLKRWRTSRVDVDSKGNSCLERMMSVLVETGPLHIDANNGFSSSSPLSWSEPFEMPVETIEAANELESVLKTIGGTSWMEAFRNLFHQNRRSSNGGSKQQRSTSARAVKK